jgi:hypothetical protein
MPFTINDSRDITNYLSANDINKAIQLKYCITNARNYKVFLQQYGEEISDFMRQDSYNKVHESLTLLMPKSK